jgi:chromosome segregation ATPase
MKPLGWVLAIAIGLVALKVYVASERKDAQREALLTQKDSTIAAQADSLRSESAALHSEIMNLEWQAVERERREAVASRRVDSLLAVSGNIANDIIIAHPDTKPLVDSLLTHIGDIIAVKDSAIADLKRENASLRVLLVRADSLIAGYQNALDAAIAQSDAWKKRAQPGIVEQARRALPFIAASYVAAKVL